MPPAAPGQRLGSSDRLQGAPPRITRNPLQEVAWVTGAEAVRDGQICCGLCVSMSAFHPWGPLAHASFIPLAFSTGLLSARFMPPLDCNTRQRAGSSGPGEQPAPVSSRKLALPYGQPPFPFTPLGTLPPGVGTCLHLPSPPNQQTDPSPSHADVSPRKLFAQWPGGHTQGKPLPLIKFPPRATRPGKQIAESL